MAAPDFSWEGMIDMCSSMGLLAKELYVYFTVPTNGMEPLGEHLEAHLSYQKKIQDDGIMVAAGPLRDPDKSDWEGEGMIIIRAQSLEEAKKIADADPMHANGARSYTIRPWLMNEGKITVEMTFSDKSAELV